VLVVFCKIEVSATGLSLVQRSPTDCGKSLCVINLVDEEAIARAGLQCQRKKSIICLWLIYSIFIENVADMFHIKSNKNLAAGLVTDARLATEKN
jgi:hypothetical protein